MGGGPVTTRFEGCVQWVGDDVFGAHLVDLDTEEEINADVYWSKVTEEDRELVRPGALFFWTIDDDHTSVIKFRRAEDSGDPA